MEKSIELKISSEVLNKVVNYLATRPYGEVFKLLYELQTTVVPLPPVKESNTAPEPCKMP